MSETAAPAAKVKPVAKITVRVVEREMGGTMWNPRTRWAKKTILLVFVEDGDGRLGVGESWLNQGGSGAIRSIIEDDLAPLVIGRMPFEARGLAHTVFRATEMSNRTGATAAAWSALDLALWDLFARQLHLPLVQLLGQVHQRVPAYASAGLYGTGKTAADLAAEVAGWVANGFDAVKIKVAGVPLKADVERVAAVREAVGPNVRLMVDALYNCDVPSALRLARALEPYDIYFLEAPVSPHDRTGQAEMAAKSPIPICGNETMAWATNFRELILAGAVDYVQFDLAACGGVGEGMRIGELAHVFQRPATLHASSTSVLYAATLHVAAALPALHSVEHHMLHQWYWDAAPDETFAVENGTLAIPPGPGIGLSLDPDSLEG